MTASQSLQQLQRQSVGTVTLNFDRTDRGFGTGSGGVFGEQGEGFLPETWEDLVCPLTQYRRTRFPRGKDEPRWTEVEIFRGHNKMTIVTNGKVSVSVFSVESFSDGVFTVVLPLRSVPKTPGYSGGPTTFPTMFLEAQDLRPERRWCLNDAKELV